MSVTPSPIGGFAAQFFDNNGVILSGGKIYTYAAGTTTPQATYTSASGVTPHANPIILDSAGRVPGGEIWLTDGLVYKFVIETATAILLGTYDNITGVNSNFVNYTVQEEVITATAGQTVFNLTTITYTPNTNSLSVYIDGVNQYVGDSYIETDSDTVTFTSGVHVGGEVKFTTAIQTTTGAVDASTVAYDPPFASSTSTNVEAKLAQYVSVKDFGAVGNGVVNDAAAIQAAINASYAVYFPAGTYLVQTKIVPTHAVDIFGAGREATTLQLKVNDFGIETTVSGRSVSIRDMTITGDTTLAANAGVNLFDNGDRPLERLEVHGFARQGIKITQTVNPILRDIRIYNCSPSQSFGAIHIDKGATACIGGLIENVYAGYSSRGVYLNGCRNIAFVNYIVEFCSIGIDALNSDGLINVGWFESNTVDINCVDSILSRINVSSTTSPPNFNASFSGSTNPWFRRTPVYFPAFAGMYNSDARVVSGANTWTTALFNGNFAAYGASITPSDTLGILSTGVYEVEWSATFLELTAAAQNVAGRIIKGATEVPGTYASSVLAANGTVTLSQKAIVSLDIGDTIKFQFSSNSASGRLQSVVVATPTNQTNATLIVKYLGAEQP